MIEKIQARQQVPPSPPPKPVTTQVTEIANGVFCILTTPGFFSSPAFYRSVEVALGTVSCAGAIGSVIYVFAGKMDSAALSSIVFVTSATSAHFAGQVALNKSMQEKLEKMETLNSQQAAQIIHYQTLFNNFKKDVADFKENNEELTQIIQKFEQQLLASTKLLNKLFQEGDLQELLKAIRELKDPESLLQRLNELNIVTVKLQDSQKELSNTEGRLENTQTRLEDTEARLQEAVEALRQMEKEVERSHAQILSQHKNVLASHAEETSKLQAVNRELATHFNPPRRVMASFV